MILHRVVEASEAGIDKGPIHSIPVSSLMSHDSTEHEQ